MPQQKRGLGRGLGALIPAAPAAPAAPDSSVATAPGAGRAGGDQAVQVEAGAYFDEIAIDSLTPNPRQPRQVFDEE